jgi:hypothetical protein
MKKLICPVIRIFRKLFFVFSVLVIFIACNVTTKPKDPIEGVWKQTHSYVLANGDTVFSTDKNVEHKIYLDGYVMWTQDPASDSSEWHGFGTYTIKNDTVIEKLLSMSNGMKAQRGSKDGFILKIDYDENNFKQVIRSEYRDTIYQSIEVYKRLKK